MKKIILFSLFIVQSYFGFGQWYQTNGPGGGLINSVAISGNNILAATNVQGLYISSDNGISWGPVKNGIQGRIIVCLAAEGSDVFAATPNGVFVSNDNGNSWSLTSITAAMNKVIVNQGLVLAEGSGSLYLSKDNGVTWENITDGLSPNYIVSVIFAGKNVIAFTNVGAFLSTDTCTSWIADSTCPYEFIGNSTVSTSADSIYMGGGAGLYQSEDYGITWKQVRTGLVDSAVNCIAINGKDIFISSAIGVSISHDAGATWALSDSGLSCTSINFLVAKGIDVFAATSGGVFISHNSGTIWMASDSGIIASYVFSFLTSGNNILAGTEAGIFSSPDNGNTWKWLGLNNYEVGGIIQLGSDFLAATTAGVFLSADNGDSWKLANSGFPVEWVYCLGLQGNNIYAGTNTGIYKSVDSGGSWIPVDSGVNTNASFTSFITIGSNILAGSNGVTYLSHNGGESWSSLDSGLAGCGFINAFAVVGSYIFTGADNGLYVSDNNGTSWKPVSNGNTIIYSLAVNGNNIYAGTPQGVLLVTQMDSLWSAVKYIQSDYFARSLTIKDNSLFVGTEGAGVWTAYLPISTASKETIENKNILLYPNPANNEISLNISCSLGFCNEIKEMISVYNSLGQLITQQPIIQSSTDINISNLSSGIYLVKITDGSGATEVKKFVKE